MNTDKTSVFRTVKVRTECGRHIVTTPHRERTFATIAEAIAYAFGAATAHF